MQNATPPCLDSFCRLDRLGLTVIHQLVHPDHSVLVCAPTTPPTPCPGWAGPGSRHDTVVRRLAHVPFGWKPTILQIRVPRYRCKDCARVWRHDVRAAAPTRGKLSRDAVTLAVKHIVIDRLSIAKIAGILGVAWNTCSDAILASADELLFHDPSRLEGVTTIGVDEHVWRHGRFGDKYVTVIIDLTPTRTNTGPSRLLAMVEGRSKQALKAWLQHQSAEFRDGVEIVAMDGFTGYKTATIELDKPGIGPVTAAIAYAAWSHTGRVRSEAAFASLAGVNPIPASSGNTIRHRINRGGDRRLNRALHMAVVTRMRMDPDTRAYVEKRTAEGRTLREIRRSLKRYLARQIYRHLNSAQTAHAGA